MNSDYFLSLLQNSKAAFQDSQLYEVQQWIAISTLPQQFYAQSFLIWLCNLTTMINFQDALKQKDDDYWWMVGQQKCVLHCQGNPADKTENIFRDFIWKRLCWPTYLGAYLKLLEFLMYWLRQSAIALMSSNQWFQVPIILGPVLLFQWYMKYPHIYDAEGIFPNSLRDKQNYKHFRSTVSSQIMWVKNGKQQMSMLMPLKQPFKFSLRKEIGITVPIF